MTTYIMPGPEDELDDLLAELDLEAEAEGKAKGKKPPARPGPILVPAPVVAQTWFPHGSALRTQIQACACGQRYESVEGVFLIDITRNGARRFIRHIGPLPETHKALPRSLETETTSIVQCPRCFQEKPNAA